MLCFFQLPADNSYIGTCLSRNNGCRLTYGAGSPNARIFFPSNVVLNFVINSCSTAATMPAAVVNAPLGSAKQTLQKVEPLSAWPFSTYPLLVWYRDANKNAGAF